MICCCFIGFGTNAGNASNLERSSPNLSWVACVSHTRIRDLDISHRKGFWGKLTTREREEEQNGGFGGESREYT